MSTLRPQQLTSPLNVTGSLYGTSSWAYSASVALTASYATNAGNSVTMKPGNQITDEGSIKQIQIYDYSDSVAATYNLGDGLLKFIFGIPDLPNPTFTINDFDTNRFNKVLDSYSITGSFNLGGYTLISASLFTGSVLIAATNTGTALSASFNTSGSQLYRLEVTSSNPANGTELRQTVNNSSSLTTLVKTQPAVPSLTATPNVQLGVYSSNRIEQGATGSISFTADYASSDAGWTRVSLTTSSVSPFYVTGSQTGSADIVLWATASYTSGPDNDPARSLLRTSQVRYTKVRSIRYGASELTFGASSRSDLENLTLWDTSLGGSIGTITGNTSATNLSFTIDWTGQKYHYIIFDSLFGTIKNLSVNGQNATVSQYFPTIVTTSSPGSQYIIYRTASLTKVTGASAYVYVITIS